MALQLRRLLSTPCLHKNPSTTAPIHPPIMLQIRAVQNFPCSCVSYTPFRSGNCWRNLGDARGYGINASLCLQLRTGSLNSRGCSGSLNYRISEVGDIFRFTLPGHGIISRRPFSSKGKKFHLRAKPKETADNVISGAKTSGNSNAVKVFDQLRKHEKSPAACNSVNGQINASITKPSRKVIVNIEEPVSGGANGATSKEQIQQGKKKRVAKNKGRVRPVEAQVEMDSKSSSKKAVEELPGRDVSSATSKPKVSRKNSKKNRPAGTSQVVKANGPIEGAKNGARQFAPLYPPSGKSVMVVESSTKAKVIQNYLGDMFEVLPSHGHVRDLAAKSRSVRPDDDFSMVWEVPATAWTHLKGIRVALSGAENLILASDPDREGEAIAWHIIEMLQQQDALKEKITVARVVFHEITESSIRSALQVPREIDMNLVNAYLARRALDYLIGFSISPLLWRKLPSCQSAGRVQSASLVLICEREMEIEQFDQQEYWTVGVDFHVTCSDSLGEGTSISSYLTYVNSQKLEQLSISSLVAAEAIEKRAYSSKFGVIGIKASKVHKSPPMPYITSTLQQDSANKLHFAAAHTMKVAQKLYEGVKLSDEVATGLITYMRTDGLHVSNEAAEDIHSFVKERYGERFASKSIRKYFRKVKNAQEAHEAIRPTNIRRLPSTLEGILDDDSLKLYTLIWTRTMACQMEHSITDMIQADIGSIEGDMNFRSVGSRVGFLGHEAVYQDKAAGVSDNDNSEEDGREAAFEALHKLKVKDALSLGKVELKQHYTKPPPRYSEGSLVKKLEELGIGRPSTYASIMKVLQDRKYVTIKSRVLYPEFRGRMVSAFLSNHFAEVADYNFTADMENELDNVSAGVTKWKGLLKDYWSRFSKYCDLASTVDVRQVEKMLEKTFRHILFGPIPNSSRVCPSCLEGTLSFKVSRFGAGYFIGCDQHPKCKYIAGTMVSEDDEDVSFEKIEKSFPPKLLGSTSADEKIFLKNGPFGYYVQLGDDRKGQTPKRASVSEVKDINSLTLEDAVELLQYPVALGNHPDDELPVLLTHSKFGFSIKHRRTIAPVPKNISPKTITLEAGLKLLQSKNAKQSGRPKSKPMTEEALF